MPHDPDNQAYDSQVMKKTAKCFGTLLVGLVGLTMLAGCSGVTASDYATVDDLKAAFVAAGGACATWNPNGIVKKAVQSGECDSQTVLSIYTSADAATEQANTIKKLMQGTGLSIHLLVGGNWIVNSVDIDKVQSKMGGQVIK